MKFFIDTADIEEIKQANLRGWVDGVTTNPSLIAKSGRDFHTVIKEICKEISGPVSAEVISLQHEEMVREGRELAKLADNVVVKVPMTEDGMIAVKKFTAEGIKTNVTLVFSPLQALLAAKAGASMVSPFVGRLDDIGTDGMSMVNQVIQIYQNYDFATEVLVASVRSPMHLQFAAEMGADIATIPFKVMQGMTHHPLTDKGIKLFMDDWNKVQKK
ncbi:fructose-6-phosphate aldolase [Bdellovibrio sp. SKB1291214]|uniref:fructose-6-phosphate aldolase n=1 Tax=Bdellovibrio sp. SKB1291214 TaxID=1732569 RepID=UPI000B519310|nr:fructose-6-phosphate aldolase [Bdellovibrio sp. SKB1291214]UYL10506.1 fructose-6-phosphate aldolase [Bdellovibrio sp. SKB1291214]